MSFWKRQPPPPPKKLYQQPVLILTLVAMFVLGPIGVIYNGMSEELKQSKGAIIQNQLAIKELLTRQQMILAPPKALKIETPTTRLQGARPVPPDYFESYMKLSPEHRAGYRKYLENLGYDVRGLP